MEIKAPDYVKSYKDGRVELELDTAFKSKNGKILLSKISDSSIPQLIIRMKRNKSVGKHPRMSPKEKG
ncbi:hypothetical protein GCM10009122_09920 [Fulvivirga kasyanovii]|uniref:DUF2283 domain-containing protein n=1 Tax=Fulvivirga kasyanovii TaxID=396812 RepID=A0ABW9RT82_9BACT|nr:hypothetical protein [Fulvivirga kasyanovii]MTI27271.1 hypothetical protein [Fulvivirga kasyanovii]